MKRKQAITPYSLVLTLLLAMCPSMVLADAGKVIFVSGSVKLATEQPLSRGDGVNEGDEIITGEDGRVQLLMQDGDRIAIRPNTRFIIRVFETLEEQANLPGQQPDGKRIYEVLEGGFRTLTDKAWKRDDDNYQVKTPVATIGIRGTDYQLYLKKVLEALSGFGLFVAVHSGGVWVRNDAGTTDVYDDEFLYIESQEDPGVLLLLPPEQFSGDSDFTTSFWMGADASGVDSSGGTYESRRSPDEEGTTGGDGDGDGDGTTPVQPINATGQDGQPADLTGGGLPSNRYTAFSSGPMGNEQEFTGSGFAPTTTMAQDAQGNLTQYPGLFPSQNGPALAIYNKGSSSVVNSGADPVTGLRWGRWAGGTASATTAAGTENIDLSQQSLHWIVSQQQAQATVLPISGEATYRLIGNTDPTDNHGNVGFMDGTSHMHADFTNQVISTEIGVSVNGQRWHATDGDGRFGQGGTFAGSFDSVQVNGGQCGNGCAGEGGYSGFFTGGNGSAPPPGAGMGYGMSQGDTTVSGSAAFGDPQ